MSHAAILAPSFVLIGLAFFLLLWMGRLRFAAVGSGAVQTRDIALGEPAWPAHIAKVGNAFHNQLELPLLYYVLVAFVLTTGVADAIFLTLSWIFVVARIVHAAIFVTTNHVRRRARAFAAGMLALLAAWLWFAAIILLPGIAS